MQDNIQKLLECEIETIFANIDLTNPGSPEHVGMTKELEVLYKLRLEEKQIEKEFEEKEKRRILDAEQLLRTNTTMEQEREYKNKQFSNDVIVGYVRTSIELAAVVLPLMFYATWMKRGFKFEESGSFTSNTFRSLFSKFRTTK